jgi:hypothetical protein
MRSQPFTTDYSKMDDALSFLSRYGFALANGFTNHAPMVSEALAAIGRADAVMPWLESQKPKFLPVRHAVQTIPDWRAALGNGDSASWSELFAGEMQNKRWPDVVGLWTARLAPAAAAGAAHGLIRAGHAVRSLAQEQTALRLRELGNALGYWASMYETLPAAEYRGEILLPSAAILHVLFSPGNARKERGSFTSGLRSLNQFPAFAPVIGMANIEGDPAKVLSDLSKSFTRVFLANAHDAYTAIGFIHGVTACTAARSLLPYLDSSAANDLLRYVWQTGAALYSVYGTAPPFDDDESLLNESRDELIERAVRNGDDHAIKFTEAALREYALNPNPVYLLAVKQALDTLS